MQSKTLSNNEKRKGKETTVRVKCSVLRIETNGDTVNSLQQFCVGYVLIKVRKLLVRTVRFDKFESK